MSGGDDAFANEAARRLADFVVRCEAVPDYSVFEPNGPMTRDAVRESIERVLSPIRDGGGLSDYSVGTPHAQTWEDLYPLMPERLLVACAYDSGELPGSCAERPDHPLRGYYRYAGFYRVSGVDADGAPWSGYSGGAEHGEPEVGEGEAFELVDWWELPTPGAMVVDLWVRPARPVTYVTVKLSPPDGVDPAEFAETLKSMVAEENQRASEPNFGSELWLINRGRAP